MRIGSNPLRDRNVRPFAPLVLGVVTHLPHTSGYHEHRFEVIQTCIRSMLSGLEQEHSLIVWDNGSCSQLRQWIRSLNPAVFVEGVNVGKATARAGIFRMVPPETMVAMSDDDVLYYPGWYEAQMQVHETYPKVACVSGNPVRTSFRWGCEKTIRWMKKEKVLEIGRFIPRQYENDFCTSIGRDPEIHKANTEADMDYRGLYKGVYAYATSHHCQFIARAGRVLPALKSDGWAMGDEKPFDIAMDSIGLRLSTVIRYSRHIGNFIHDELREEIKEKRLC